MGNIVSKLKNYVHTKVENTKTAIRNKVDNTKQAICTRVDNTKQVIVNKVTDTRDAICLKVINTKNGIGNRINAASDAVFTTVNNIRDGITTRITNTVTGIRNAKDGVVRRCVNTKNAVVTRYTNTKNSVVTRYTNSRNAVVNRYCNSREAVVKRYTDSRSYVQGKYRQLREAKLTKYEKLKYSLLFLVAFSLFVLTLATAWDLYYENFERIHDRNQMIWLGICYTSDSLWYVTELTVTYLYLGTVFVLENLWYTTQVCSYYAWEGTKLAAHHTWEGLKIAASYTLEGSTVAWAYFSHGCKVAGTYAWHGAGIAWEYFTFGANVTWEYIVLGSKWGLHYGVEGSKLAVEYSIKGTKYAAIHGSIALKDGSIKFFQWLFYFLTNFRAASKEAAVYLYETSIYTGSCIMTGSYHGSIMLWDGTQYAATKTCEGTVLLWEGTVATACFTRDVITSGMEMFVHGTDVTAAAIYNAMIFSIVTVYEWTIWFGETAYHSTVVSVDFLWTWSDYVIKTSSHGLYVGFNKYGLVWAYNGANKVTSWSCTLGNILWKFLTDLVTYLGNCFYTGGSHIYNVFYIVFSFVYQIFSGVSHVIRTSSKGMVYCVTTVFGAIIWALEETIFAYMFMLNQYNMYREILFAGFLAVMILYCTGLMRDRKRSLEERNGECESSSESEDDEVDESQPRLIPREKDLKLPEYPEVSSKKFPTCEDLMAEDYKLSPSMSLVTKPTLEDLLPPSDDDDEFDLEQNVPDFMDLSGSEPEPEPPELESPDQDTDGVHDLSFESRDSLGHDSTQEVPDIDHVSDDDQQDEGHLVPEGQQSGDDLDLDLAEEVVRNVSEVRAAIDLDNMKEEALNSDLDEDDLNRALQQAPPGHEADVEDEDEIETEVLLQRLDSIKRRKEEANSEQRDNS